MKVSILHHRPLIGLIGTITAASLFSASSSRAAQPSAPGVASLQQRLAPGRSSATSARQPEAAPLVFQIRLDEIRSSLQQHVQAIQDSRVCADVVRSRASPLGVAEIQAPLRARLSEAEDYLCRGEMEQFTDTLVALTMPPLPQKNGMGDERYRAAEQIWLDEWKKAALEGRPRQAQELLETLRASVLNPVGD